jgi:TetR/AcrR family fatty acid metabolism transcriptional regulator
MSLFTRGKLGEYLNLLKKIIEEGQESGVFRQDIHPALATNVVFGAVDESVMSWVLADQPGDLTRNVEPILGILTRGMMT